MNAELEFWLLLLTLLGLVLLCVKPLGTYMANVMDGTPTFATRMAGSGPYVVAWPLTSSAPVGVVHSTLPSP